MFLFCFFDATFVTLNLNCMLALLFQHPCRYQLGGEMGLTGTRL